MYMCANICMHVYASATSTDQFCCNCSCDVLPGADLVICLCYNPRRLKAPQTSTSTSGTTSALPPGPVYEELTTEDKKRADQMEMKGNVAYGPSNQLPLEQNVAYETMSY